MRTCRGRPLPHLLTTNQLQNEREPSSPWRGCSGRAVGSWWCLCTTGFTFSEMRRVLRLLVSVRARFFIITGLWREFTGVAWETDTSSACMLSFGLAGCTVRRRWSGSQTGLLVLIDRHCLARLVWCSEETLGKEEGSPWRRGFDLGLTCCQFNHTWICFLVDFSLNVLTFHRIFILVASYHQIFKIIFVFSS